MAEEIRLNFKTSKHDKKNKQKKINKNYKI